MTRPDVRRWRPTRAGAFVPLLGIIFAASSLRDRPPEIDAVARLENAVRFRRAALRNGNLRDVVDAEHAVRLARRAAADLLVIGSPPRDTGEALGARRSDARREPARLARAVDLLLHTGPTTISIDAGAVVARTKTAAPATRERAAAILVSIGALRPAADLTADLSTPWGRLVFGRAQAMLGDRPAARRALLGALASEDPLVELVAFEGLLSCGVEVSDVGAPRFARLLDEMRPNAPRRLRALAALARHRESGEELEAAWTTWRALLDIADTDSLVDVAWEGMRRLRAGGHPPDTSAQAAYWQARIRTVPERAPAYAETLRSAGDRGPAFDDFRLWVADRLRRLGRFDEADGVLEPLLAADPGTRRRGQGLLARARVARTRGRWDDVVAAYTAAAENAHVRADALFELGWEHHTSGRLAEARALYARARAAGLVSFDLPFRSALAALADGGAATAASELVVAGREARSSADAARAAFWSAMAAAGGPADRRARLATAAAGDAPYAYVARALRSGLLGAGDSLAWAGGAPPPGGDGRILSVPGDRPLAPALDALTVLEEPASRIGWPEMFTAAVMATHLGARDAAVRSLRRALRARRGAPDSLAATGETAAELGFPEIALSSAVHLPERYGARRLRLAYPIAYLSEIREAIAASGAELDPLLVLAVIRQESAFDPAALSAAAAHGLMQLLDRTAATEAALAALPAPPRPEDLNDPKLNIRLGVQHLASLARDRDLFRVVAAYNAGIEAVDRWGSPSGDPWLWVETAPYFETRDYLRRVIGGYLAYRDVYRASIDEVGHPW
jgi:soluble lytic murein transglycosylase-like protein